MTFKVASTKFAPPPSMNGWDIFWEVEACLDAPRVGQVVADWGGEYVPISLATHKENAQVQYAGSMCDQL